MDYTQKWITVDNMTGTSTLKQHCFIPRERKRKYTGEKYLANVSLCGKVRVGNENEEVEEWEKLNPDGRIEESACKICKRKSTES